MPICYHISLPIHRDDGEGGGYDTTLPGTITSADPLSNEEIINRATSIWDMFSSFLGDTAPDRAKQYSWSGVVDILGESPC
jgi:hypothetical protein